MDEVMTLVRHAFLCALLLAACSVAQGQTKEDWSLDVRLLTSLPFGRPAVGDGSGWGGQALAASDGPLFGRWGLRGTRSYGVSIRRSLGKVGQLAFGFEQTRRIWQVEADWMPQIASAPVSSGSMEWIVASYSWPILYRTEVTLTPGWRLGAGGGLLLEILPTNAFTSTSTEQDGNVLALEQESLRYNWNRWGMALELGLVKEGEEADLHIGGVLRPLIQPLSQAGLTARWNVGQGDADTRTILRTLDGSWWGLDVRFILH
jgi:hypothetical protein